MKDAEKIVLEEFMRAQQEREKRWQELVDRVMQYIESHPFFSKSKPPFDRDFVESLITFYGVETLRLEFKKMTLWLKADPRRQKKNYRRFVVNWLNRRDQKIYLEHREY